MSQLNDNMNKILDITPSAVVLDTVSLPATSVGALDVSDDFAVARNNIRNIIERGDDALECALELAKESEHPRTYEVVGQLIKVLVDANKDLLNIHKQRKEFNTTESESSAKNVTNAIFVGSTAELQKIIRGKTNVE